MQLETVLTSLPTQLTPGHSGTITKQMQAATEEDAVPKGTHIHMSKHLALRTVLGRWHSSRSREKNAGRKGSQMDSNTTQSPHPPEGSMLATGKGPLPKPKLS